MTVKIIASSMLFIGCLMLGMEISRRMKLRKETLKQLISCLELMENYIMSLKLPLADIYRRLSEEKLVGEMFKGMSEKSILNQEQLWKEGLLNLPLVDKDRVPLIELSRVLGSGNSEFQKKQIDLCKSSLIKLYEEADRQYLAEGTLYRKLGVYMGILLILLLI